MDKNMSDSCQRPYLQEGFHEKYLFFADLSLNLLLNTFLKANFDRLKPIAEIVKKQEQTSLIF
jgi:hypothetical protein